MCGCICIEFIAFILKRKSLLDYSNLFFPNKNGKNDNTILNYFQ